MSRTRLKRGNHPNTLLQSISTWVQNSPELERNWEGESQKVVDACLPAYQFSILATHPPIHVVACQQGAALRCINQLLFLPPSPPPPISSLHVLPCYLPIYDSFVCCLSRLSEITDLAPHLSCACWANEAWRKHSSLHDLVVHQLLIDLFRLGLRLSIIACACVGVTSWHLTGDLLPVRCRDSELTRGTYFDLLVLSRVQDL